MLQSIPRCRKHQKAVKKSSPFVLASPDDRYTADLDAPSTTQSSVAYEQPRCGLVWQSYVCLSLIDSAYRDYAIFPYHVSASRLQ